MKEIGINSFQLNVLLDNRQKEIYKMVTDTNVFCMTCGGVCEEGIEIDSIFLNDLNDILVKGTCNKCGNNVARTLEFGEDKDFYDKAVKLRKSISS